MRRLWVYLNTPFEILGWFDTILWGIGGGFSIGLLIGAMLWY